MTRYIADYEEDIAQEIECLRLEGWTDEQEIRSEARRRNRELRIGKYELLRGYNHVRQTRTGQLFDVPFVNVNDLQPRGGERDEEVRDAVANLTPKLREAAELFYLDAERPKRAEVAERLGISISAMERRLERVRSTLRKELAA